jgi:hypothetical protein
MQITKAFLRFNHFGTYQQPVLSPFQCGAEDVGVASVFQPKSLAQLIGRHGEITDRDMGIRQLQVF